MGRRPNALNPLGAWFCVGLFLAGCERDDKLDTDSPWPADGTAGGSGGGGEGEGEGEGEGLDSFVGVLTDVAASAIDDTGDPTTVLSVVVNEDTLLVTHDGVSLAPCDDFNISGTTSESTRAVEATYDNADCGTGDPHSLNWSMPAPQSPGEWTLTIAGDVTSFEIE
jgi:hypothetical protein